MISDNTQRRGAHRALGNYWAYEYSAMEDLAEKTISKVKECPVERMRMNELKLHITKSIIKNNFS